MNLKMKFEWVPCLCPFCRLLQPDTGGLFFLRQKPLPGIPWGEGQGQIHNLQSVINVQKYGVSEKIDTGNINSQMCEKLMARKMPIQAQCAKM